MASYFIDLDGCFFHFGTMNPNPGWPETINNLISRGHQVFFTTLRETVNVCGPQELNIPATEKWLAENGVDYTAIIEGVQSPRVLVNDEGATAINHVRNESICIDDLCLCIQK